MILIGLLLLANTALTIWSAARRVQDRRNRKAAQAAGYGVLK